MVMSCCAPGCKSRAGAGTLFSFHGFPKDPVLREQWTIATRRENFVPNQYSKLCSKHFETEDFDFVFGQKKIKPNVVPSKFPIPNSLQIKTTRKKAASSVRPRTEEQEISSNLQPTLVEFDQIFLFEHSFSSEGESEEDPIQEGQCEQAASPIPLRSTVIIKKKRKHLQNGGIKDPKKNNVATQTFDTQRRTIMYLKKRVCCLEKKVLSLNNTVHNLMSQNNYKIGSKKKDKILKTWK